MTVPSADIERLRFLARVAGKEARHLATTTERLFQSPFTPARVAVLTDVNGRMQEELRRRGWV